jgi:hypothetical protein
MPKTVRFGQWAPAALCLATGGSPLDAAAASRVTLRTLARWRRQPAFAAQVRRHRDDLAAQALGRLCDHLGRAADTLADLLDDPRPAVRLRAAAALLDAAASLRGDVDPPQLAAEPQSQPDGVPAHGSNRHGLPGRRDSRGGPRKLGE